MVLEVILGARGEPAGPRRRIEDLKPVRSEGRITPALCLRVGVLAYCELVVFGVT
jgi:hypothetical protein